MSDYKLKGSTCLVTGGGGCLGSTIVDRLIDEEVERVDALDDLSEGYEDNLDAAYSSPRFGSLYNEGSLADGKFVSKVIQDYDYVFHCGGHLLLKAQSDGHAAIDTNVHGTLNVLESALAAGVKKVVFTSSISIFGEPDYVPVDENHPLNNTTIYGATKIAGEHLCREFGRRGLAYSIIRPYNIVGPRQSPKNGAFSQVVPRWIRCIQRGEPIVIHGTGEQCLDLVHVSDMANAHVLAMQRRLADGEAFNIGSGKSTSANELARLLLEAFEQPDHPVQHIPHEVSLVQKRCCDIRKAQSWLGYEPYYDARKAIADTVDWWEEKERACSSS